MQIHSFEIRKRSLSLFLIQKYSYFHVGSLRPSAAEQE